MKCGDCLHYSRTERRIEAVEHGRCNCDKFTESSEDNMFVDGLDYWDYEGYSAGFYVGESFGCIHYKKRGE